MEVKYEDLKRQMEETIENILMYDTPDIQREHLDDHAGAIIVMCDSFHIINHEQAVELRNMALEAKNRIK